MINKVFCIIVLALFCLPMNAQVGIQGRVTKDDGTPVPYANIVLLNKSDSAFVSGTISGEDGLFSLQTDTENIIKVSSIGFDDTYVSDFDNKPLDIKLHSRSVMLGEVTVKSSVPITRMENNALVTNVKGTILEKLGTAKDVLGRLPGIIVERGVVSVLGKGSPAIYINGRLVRNDNVLDQLQSVKIKKVELVNNPGARYDASISSVICIYVERNPGEGFSLDNKTTVGYRNYPSVSEQVDLNYRYNDFDVFATFEYERRKDRGNSTNIQNTWLVQHYMQDVDICSRSRQQLYDGKLGFNYSPTSKHVFGGYYQVSNKPVKVATQYKSESLVDGLLNELSDIGKDAKSNTTEHLIDGYYSGNLGKWTIDATFDFLWKDNSKDELSEEKNGVLKNRTVTINDNSKGSIVAGEIHALHSLLKGNVNFGVEASSSRRSEKTLNLEQIILDADDEVREDNISAYVETSQRIGKINFQLGVRYEHIDSRYYEHDVFKDEQSYIYDNVFPTASFMLPIKKSILQMSYSKKYERPLYSQMSSAVSYVNRYLYQSGNPLLSSQYSDNYSLAFRYKWLIIMANYTYTDGKIIDECMMYGDDATVTLLRKGNSLVLLHKYQFMAVAAPHFGIYYPNLMVGVLGQDYHIDYMGAKKEFNKPMLIVRWNNVLRFKNGYLANIDMGWRSPADSENVRVGKTFAINAGISKQYGKHWNVKFNVNDVFNTSKKNNFIMYSGISDVQITKYITSRNVECTIRYSFNTAKTKYKGSGAGETERKRL